jgi:hypothetical protein
MTHPVMRSVLGAGGAYLLKVNPYAGAAIGGLSVLTDEVTLRARNAFDKHFFLLSNFLGSSPVDFLFRWMSTTCSFYALKTRHVVSFPQIFLIDAIARLWLNPFGGGKLSVYPIESRQTEEKTTLADRILWGFVSI